MGCPDCHEPRPCGCDRIDAEMRGRKAKTRSVYGERIATLTSENEELKKHILELAERKIDDAIDSRVDALESRWAELRRRVDERAEASRQRCDIRRKTQFREILAIMDDFECDR
jgi:hypothetical protein